jgi:hypothetical protein
MPDFYKKITEGENTIESLVRRIPGFKGYLERQDRRAADKLLREKLSRGFEGQLREFTRLQKRLVDQGGLKYMDRAQAVDVKLRTFVDKVESAVQGYSGLFDAVKVDEEALARVYAFDNALFEYEDQLASGLKRLAEVIGTDEVSGVLDELEQVAAEALRMFDRRGEAMQNMQDTV